MSNPVITKEHFMQADRQLMRDIRADMEKDKAMTEFKVGDFVRVHGAFSIALIEKLYAEDKCADLSGISLPVKFKEMQKVYVSDTPPPQPVKNGNFVNADDLIKYLKSDDGEDHMISRSELEHDINVFADNHGVKFQEIKSGHMAGYGVDVPRVVQFSPPEDGKNGTVLYNNNMMFELACEEWHKVPLPHEQEDLKHLFE